MVVLKTMRQNPLLWHSLIWNQWLSSHNVSGSPVVMRDRETGIYHSFHSSLTMSDTHRNLTLGWEDFVILFVVDMIRMNLTITGMIRG